MLYLSFGIISAFIFYKYIMDKKERDSKDMSAPFLMFVWGPMGLVTVTLLLIYKYYKLKKIK